MSVKLTDQMTLEMVIIPVLVSIATTLVVEYFAKPKLEARKARLIRDRQQIDKVVFDFQRVGMAIGAMPTIEKVEGNKVHRKHFEIMLQEASEGLYSLTRNLSGLSTRYVVNHSRHVSQTSLFVGYLLSQVELLVEDLRSVDISKLKDDAKSLELFDLYFLVYIYMQDSQEDWFRRIFWRLRREKKNREQIELLLKEKGLDDDKEE